MAGGPDCVRVYSVGVERAREMESQWERGVEMKLSARRTDNEI